MMIEALPNLMAAAAAGIAGIKLATHNGPQSSWWDHVSAGALVAGAAAVALSALMGYAPVTVDVRGEVVSSRPGEVVMAFTANRLRHCERIGRAAYVMGKRGRELATIDEMDAELPSILPLGMTYLGEFRIRYDYAKVKPRSGYLILHHRCPWPFGLTETTTQPFRIPQPQELPPP